MEVILIPGERTAVLVGARGETKKMVEQKGSVKLNVSSEGEVQITAKDPYAEYRAREVVRAIGRGFSPQKALKLFSEVYYLKIVDLKDLLGSDKEIIRVKGRIIGENGKSRRIIEELSETDLCVYGSTVSIIGTLEELALAAEALEALIGGASHSRVYALLEKGRRKLKEGQADLWEKKVD